jgi:polar amino acid transport system substrate-binding protein
MIQCFFIFCFCGYIFADLPEKLEQTLDEMKEDGTSAKIIGKYLDNPEKYLEVDQLEEE